MTLNEYQKLAMRTCCIPYDKNKDMLRHAVFGLCSEAGEVAQMIDEAHPWLLIDMEHFKKELGDCCWMIAEATTAIGENMYDLKYDMYDTRSYSDILSAALQLTYKAGIVAGLLQKEYQGHEFDKAKMSLALGNCFAVIMNICSMCNINLYNDVLQLNIDKLRARFPEGFDPDKSLHRAEGDI